jgi:hypothetical protein
MIQLLGRRSLLASFAAVIAAPAAAQIVPLPIPQSGSDCGPIADPGARTRCQGQFPAPTPQIAPVAPPPVMRVDPLPSAAAPSPIGGTRRLRRVRRRRPRKAAR